MTKYKQLVQEQRYVIGRLLKAGKTQEEMATAVGCHKSAITRELKRNVQTLVSRSFGAYPVVASVLQLGEVAGFEALTFDLALMFI